MHGSYLSYVTRLLSRISTVDCNLPRPIKCTDGATNLRRPTPNKCTDPNRYRGNPGPKYVRMSGPSSPPIFRGPREVQVRSSMFVFVLFSKLKFRRKLLYLTQNNVLYEWRDDCLCALTHGTRDILTQDHDPHRNRVTIDYDSDRDGRVQRPYRLRDAGFGCQSQAMGSHHQRQ